MTTKGKKTIFRETLKLTKLQIKHEDTFEKGFKKSFI